MSAPFPAGFSGIDPALMGEMIEEMRRGRADITGTVAPYRARLAALGVDTAPLTEIDRVCGWLDAQLPMLTRRRDLAIALDDNSEPGLAPIDESLVLTPAEARRQGNALAARLQGLHPEDGVHHEILNELGLHRFDPDYTAAFFARLGGEGTRRLPGLVEEHARLAHVDRQLREVGEAFAGAVSGGRGVPGFGAVADAMFARDLPTAERQGVAALASHGTYPPRWLAALTRQHALDPLYRQYTANPDMRAADLNTTDWQTVRGMLQALGNNPVASRLAFQGVADAHPSLPVNPTALVDRLPAPEKRTPDLAGVLTAYTRLAAFDSQTAEQLGRALAAGSGADDEKDGRHSQAAARFAFTVMTTIPEAADAIPEPMRLPMSRIAASYVTEITEGANIDDRHQDTAFGKVKSYTPGLKPLFSLSPEDTYEFLKTFADSPEHMRPFEQGMGALTRRLGAEGIRIETAKKNGAIHHDTPGLERVMQALGYVAGLQSQAQKTVQGELDEQDALRREQLRQLADVGFDLGTIFVPMAPMADEMVWGMLTKVSGSELDRLKDNADENTRLKRLEDRELQTSLGLQHAMVQRLIRRGYPMEVTPWEAEHPHPGHLFYNNATGHLLPYKEITGDPKLLDNYISWLNANGRGGDDEAAFGQIAVNATGNFRGMWAQAADYASLLEREQEKGKGGRKN
ncbi:DUF6571 family protein [Actinomadura namibiensis]|uniref:Uncharacterized protein n=1 Tax=Actinomadura namibiensis TaxID=182080 RepID=A0A7W3LP76_ACTNM|nr:DUF6571 family protein [Actinomadura namibiensis]MBA8951740.1 hypothetical protein [Actinomadura namibiensis]